jgi:medium-chain acyl-[acyl-carrier-protein] hydrolase
MLSRRESFAVHTYEVDAFGTLAVPALSGYLSEVAGLHAGELGVGLDALMARGLTWVLLRQRIENPIPIQLGDGIEIETWPSGIERLVALREFVVRRGGEEVARATTQWLVLDVATRRPVRPAEVLEARFPREARPPAVPLAHGKLADLRAWDFQKRFHVRYSDIDANLHVTNTSYVAWAIEAVPRDLWQSSRLASVEVQFLAETHHGAAILSRVATVGDGALAHAIVREEDRKELARLATRWVRREGAPGR